MVKGGGSLFRGRQHGLEEEFDIDDTTPAGRAVGHDLEGQRRRGHIPRQTSRERTVLERVWHVNDEDSRIQRRGHAKSLVLQSERSLVHVDFGANTVSASWGDQAPHGSSVVRFALDGGVAFHHHERDACAAVELD